MTNSFNNQFNLNSTPEQLQQISQQDYDLVIIGAGSGGIACANRAAIHGAKVLIIDNKELGGTCVNRGCVPKKVLWNGANLLSMIHEYAPSYGINLSVNSIDFATLKANRDAYIQRIQNSYANALNNNNITVVQGYASLVNTNTVKIDLSNTYNFNQLCAQASSTSSNSTHLEVKGKKILLALGSESTVANIPGGELGIHSDGFFELNSLPKDAIVIGAGYIAVELAGVLNSFGTKVTLVTRGDRPLRWADHDITNHLLKTFKDTQLNHLAYTKVLKVESLENTTKDAIDSNSEQSAKYRVYLETTINGESSQFSQDTSCLIWAVGRHPHTKNFDFGTSGVQVDEKGFIITDKLNQTNISNIFAIGDVVHMPALTPAAVSAGRRLAERLFNNRENCHFDHTLIPTVIFSHPAIGTIGDSEELALTKYGKFDKETNPNGIKVYTSTFTSMVSVITDHRQECFMKLVVQGVDEKVIGLHGIGYGVDEMIQGFAVAMNMGATKSDFDNTLAIHPTGAEEFVTMK